MLRLRFIHVLFIKSSFSSIAEQHSVCGHTIVCLCFHLLMETNSFSNGSLGSLSFSFPVCNLLLSTSGELFISGIVFFISKTPFDSFYNFHFSPHCAYVFLNI